MFLKKVPTLTIFPPLSLPLPALHSLSFPLGSTTFLSPPLFPLSRSFPLRAVVVVHDFETALSSANNGLKTTERVELVIQSWGETGLPVSFEIVFKEVV